MTHTEREQIYSQAYDEWRRLHGDTLDRVIAERDRLRELLNLAVEWVSDRGYDDPETAPEWFLAALQEAGDGS
jgi:hypothetical protein